MEPARLVGLFSVDLYNLARLLDNVSKSVKFNQYPSMSLGKIKLSGD
jgi:hypothetical protein